jgi:hypothetical protein
MFQKELYNFQSLYKFVQSILNCHNVAKHAEFYLDSYGSMRLSVVMQNI